MIVETSENVLEGRSQQPDWERKSMQTLHNSGLDKAKEIKTGHIWRMKDKHLIKTVMLGMFEGDVSYGRPARWSSNQ